MSIRTFPRIGLLVGLTAVAAMSSAQNPNDSFKVLSEQHTVWCLNKEFLVIQPWDQKFWKHDNKVPIAGLSHSTDCRKPNPLTQFDELEVKGQAPNLKLTLKSGGQPVTGYKNLPLTRDQANPTLPRFWSWKGSNFDLYLLMAEKRNSKNKLVRYYILEAFSVGENSDCNLERPDQSGLAEFEEGMTCEPPAIRETGVSGGGEGK